ncbi:uncharacterized protein LOC143768334 [Ranitomeya variabilis]|uniref:uncharacterized protein LOC143768334 n=1 Tax=Ranitomeya variabilis TaxID=490064 RepID=UPI004056770B
MRGAEGSVRKGEAGTSAHQWQQVRSRKGRGQDKPQATGVMTAPTLETAAEASEALGEKAVSEEIRRMEREELAASDNSSQYESLDEEVVEQPKKTGDNRTSKSRKKRKNKAKKSKPPPLATGVPTEGLADSPLIPLSNRFQALDDSAVSEVGGEGPVATSGVPSGSGEVCPPGDSHSSGGGTTSGSRGKESISGKSSAIKEDMDTSVSLKRRETPRMGRGLWKLNSSLLEEAEVRQSFEEFLQSQQWRSQRGGSRTR